MFPKTRLKLTIWYLAIIMFISLLFSAVIYLSLAHELERIERIQRYRIENRQFLKPLFLKNPYHQTPLDPQVFDQARIRILYTLIFVNLIILLSSGALGYFLAGKALRPVKDMLDEQNRFIADASHELRTPITSLKSEIEVYTRGGSHTLEEADRLLASNLEEANNLQILSDNLIQLAQYQKPNNAGDFTKVSLAELIGSSEKKFKSLAKQKSITIKNKVKDCAFLGDKDSLIQLFSIFLDNAIKYSPHKSKVAIETKIINRFIFITIKDQGIGIEDKDIPHIFDRFYRSDASRTKQNVQGYGLGLSIAKKIVDMHHGIISVKSRAGKGTAFTIQFPYPKES